jgi:hypothetical protein
MTPRFEIEPADEIDLDYIVNQADFLPYLIDLLDELAKIERATKSLKAAIIKESAQYGINVYF